MIIDKQNLFSDDQAITVTADSTNVIDLGADDSKIQAINEKGGVELWVLCGRKTVEANKTKRDAATQELRQRELQVLAKRHLNDLRRDAHIEYR